MGLVRITALKNAFIAATNFFRVVLMLGRNSGNSGLVEVEH
jgi:hypothetical protein